MAFVLMILIRSFSPPQKKNLQTSKFNGNKSGKVMVEDSLKRLPFLPAILSLL